MTIEQLIELVVKRMTYLSALRAAAERLGDVQQIIAIDAELADSQATLDSLRAI
jgi:hypothetical protein